MGLRSYRHMAFLCLILMYSGNAFSLTIQQFSELCHSSDGQCSANPAINAYIGGAVDLLATLQERTDYIEKLYCKESAHLFDVPTIIAFMERQAGIADQANAMLLFIEYFEQNGGCNQ